MKADNGYGNGDLEMITFTIPEARPESKCLQRDSLPAPDQEPGIAARLEHPCCSHRQQPRSWALPKERRNSNLQSSKVALVLLTRS